MTDSFHKKKKKKMKDLINFFLKLKNISHNLGHNPMG